MVRDGPNRQKKDPLPLVLGQQYNLPAKFICGRTKKDPPKNKRRVKMD